MAHEPLVADVCATVQTATVRTATVRTATVQTATVRTATVQTATVRTATVQTATVQTATAITVPAHETDQNFLLRAFPLNHCGPTFIIALNIRRTKSPLSNPYEVLI